MRKTSFMSNLKRIFSNSTIRINTSYVSASCDEESLRDRRDKVLVSFVIVDWRRRVSPSPPLNVQLA